MVVKGDFGVKRKEKEKEKKLETVVARAVLPRRVSNYPYCPAIRPTLRDEANNSAEDG